MQPAGEVLSDHFSTWRAAFGDMTWSGYKSEAMETFQRARSTRFGATLRRMGTTMSRSVSRSFTLPRSYTSQDRHVADAHTAAEHGERRAGSTELPAIKEQDSTTVC